MRVLAESISARITSINSFLDPYQEPVEDTLARMDMIDLSASRTRTEILDYERGFHKDLPTTEQMWKDVSTQIQYQNPPSRSLPLCLVLGPTGSGKTWFALHYLRRKALVPPKRKVVTLYLQPGTLTGIGFEPNNPSSAQVLIHRIRQECAKAALIDMPDKLDMHVCLVLDKAGSKRNIKEWLESKAMLETLCQEASQLATSVTVVVVGGLTGRDLNPSKDAFVFRMKPWQARDLSIVMASYVNLLRLEEQETIDTVANAIFAHSKLGALATNARAASFLVQAVSNLSVMYSRWSWEMQLEEWATTLVTDVVDKFRATSDIATLKAHEQRRVAASIFLALQKIKQGETSNLPTFSELEEDEIPIAESLLQYNLALSTTNDDNDDNDALQILPGADFACTLPPGLVLVLYSMAGMFLTTVPGGRNEVELAALYAFRQSMVKCMEQFMTGIKQGRNRQDCQKDLDKSLARVRLVRLHNQEQHFSPPSNKSENVLVPMVDGETILMMMNLDSSSSDDGAFFADVIAPYTLIFAKQTNDSSKPLEVNLYKEMAKCGLVKERDEKEEDGTSITSDSRLIRGLMALWQNKLHLIPSQEATTPTPSSSLQEQEEKVERNHQCSKAFPENVFSRVASKDPFHYAVIPGNGATTMTLNNHDDIGGGTTTTRTIIPLPDLEEDEDGTMIRLILLTNAEALTLILGPSIPKVTITKANTTFHDDGSTMEMNVETLQDSEAQSNWKTFVQDRLQKGVQLKFLFTTSQQ